MTVPIYATSKSAAADLTSTETYHIDPGRYALISTGVFGRDVFTDETSNIVGLVCPRSGLAANHGVTVLNAPGVIDADYKGEIKVLLINHGRITFDVEPGMRIAQLLLVKRSINFDFDIADVDRVAGFGSTGV